MGLRTLESLIPSRCNAEKKSNKVACDTWALVPARIEETLAVRAGYESDKGCIC